MTLVGPKIFVWPFGSFVAVFEGRLGPLQGLDLINLSESCPIYESYVHIQMKHTAKMKSYKKNDQTKICTQIIQNGVTKKCNIYIKKKRNRHQHNIDDDGQAMGEEMRHVQMCR